MESLIELNKWFDSQGGLANLFGIVGPILVTIGVVFRYIYKTRRLQQELDKNFEERLSLLNNQVNALKKELDESKQFNPKTWIEINKEERKNGNEERAIAALRNGVQLTRDALYQSYFELARYHISLYPDQGNTPHLQEADRTARIATLLKPGDKTTQALLVEIDAIMAMKNIQTDQYDPDNTDITFQTPELYSAIAYDTETIINKLISNSNNNINSGHYMVAERLAYRARLIGLRTMEDIEPAMQVARFTWADTLSFCGQHTLALSEIETLMTIEEHAYGTDHPNTLATRQLRAGILKSLYRHNDALDEIEKLLQIKERTNDPNTQLLHSLRADCLYATGRYEDALAEIELLLPMDEHTYGAEHPNTLFSRASRARILTYMGRYDDALNEIEMLLPIQKHVDGAEHPHTLFSRSIRAEILTNMGHYEDALNEIESVLPIQKTIIGPEHTNTLGMRMLYARILIGLKCNANALSEVDTLLPIMERIMGTEHTDTIYARNFRAELLDDMDS